MTPSRHKKFKKIKETLAKKKRKDGRTYTTFWKALTLSDSKVRSRIYKPYGRPTKVIIYITR